MRHHLRIVGRATDVQVSSAGTHTSRPGAKPDVRAQRVSASAGVDVSGIRASRLTVKDIKQNDLIFAMDSRNLQKILEICPQQHQHKISLLLSHMAQRDLDEVPDPYYGGYQGFVEVFRLIEKVVPELVRSHPTLNAKSLP